MAWPEKGSGSKGKGKHRGWRNHHNQRHGQGGSFLRDEGRGQPSNRSFYKDLEERLCRREEELSRREAALAARQAQFDAGSTEDTVLRLSELTNNYMKDVLHTFSRAGRPDVASAMLKAVVNAGREKQRDRSRSRSSCRLGEASSSSGGKDSLPDKREEIKEEIVSCEKSREETGNSYDDELPDFGSD